MQLEVISPGCTLDTYSVGYGNQSPVTAAGRALVFTFGFLSILCFGAVLATSGTITTHLVEDFFIRLRFRIFTNKVVMIIIWGVLWVAQMIFIAGHSIQWRIWRLDETMSMEDGIWFAYIRSVPGLGFQTQP
jgi:Ion channel